MHFFPSQSISYPPNRPMSSRGNNVERDSMPNNVHSHLVDYSSVSRCAMYNSPAKLMKLEPTTPTEFLQLQTQLQPSTAQTSASQLAPPPPPPRNMPMPPLNHSTNAFFSPPPQIMPHETNFNFLPPKYPAPHLPNSAATMRFFSPQRPKFEKYMHSSFTLRHSPISPTLANSAMPHSIAGDPLSQSEVIHSNTYFPNGTLLGDSNESIHHNLSSNGGDSSNYSLTPEEPNPQQQQHAVVDGDVQSGNGSGISDPQVRTHRIGRRCKPKEDRRCGVCGDKALSCNFDALTCESCKAFFRRNASKDVNSFKCPYKGMCNITVGTRRLCKQCRIRRCFDIGMKKEYILSMEERSEKQQKIRQNKIIKKLEERNWIGKDLSMTELATKRLLSEAEIHLIDEVVEAYNASLWLKLENRAGSRESPSIADLVNLAEISIRRAIEMFKRIKAFRNLDKKAQVGLLKSGCIELLVIRGVLSYDPLKRRFLDSADNEKSDSMSLESVMLGAGGDAGSAFKRLIQSLLIRTQCCHVTMLLLLIICLFSNRAEFLTPHSPQQATIKTEDPIQLANGETKMSDHGGHEKSDFQFQEEVENLQLMYSHLLKNYLATKWSIKEAERLFPQIMVALSDLCTINAQFSRQMMNVNVNNVTPLMTEMLDIPISPHPPQQNETRGEYESQSTSHTSSSSGRTSSSNGGVECFHNPPSSSLDTQNTVATLSSDANGFLGGQNDINHQVSSIGWTPSSLDMNDAIMDPASNSIFNLQ